MLVVAQSTGCLQAESVGLPDLTDARSAIVGFEGERSRFFAVDLDDPQWPPLTANDGTPLVMLLYAPSLDEMALEPGPITIEEGGRPLVPALRRYDAAAPERLWLQVDDPARLVVPGIRIPDLDRGTCESRGGCFRVSASTYCELPCVGLPQLQAPMAPEPPEPPNLLPCASGFAAEDRDGQRVCTAPPVTSPCTDGQVQYLGSANCLPVGAACPVGRWSGDVPVDARFVEPGPPGAGTQASPHGSLQEALQASSDGEVLALAKGQYTAQVQIDRSLTLVGACAAETVITGAQDATIESIAPNVSLQNLSVRGGTFGVRVTQGSLQLAGVEVADSTFGISVDSASMVAQDTSIRDVNIGVYVRGESGAAELTNAVVKRADELGAWVESGELRLTTGWIRRITRRPSTRNFGVFADLGARVVISGSQLGPTAGNNLGLWGASTALVSQTVFEGTLGEERSFAIDITEGASLEGSQLRVESGAIGGLWLNGGTAQVQDAVFENNSGPAVLVRQNSALELTRVLSRRDTFSGIDLETGQATLSDLKIEQTQPGEGGGTGLLIRGATVNGNKVAVESTSRTCVSAASYAGEVSTVSLMNLRTGPPNPAPGVTARSVFGASGTLVTLNRAELIGARGPGLELQNGPGSSFTDVRIEGAEAQGALLIAGDRITMSRVALVRNTLVGLELLGAEVNADNLEIEGTRPGEVPERGAPLVSQWCADDPNLPSPFAAGICLFGRAVNVGNFSETKLTASQFQLVDNIDRGVVIKLYAEANLDLGEISAHSVGVDVRQANYELGTIRPGIAYRNNGQDLSSF